MLIFEFNGCHHYSYRYWKLTPHQATRDPEKSPSDPIREVKNVLTGGRRSKDIERDGNGVATTNAREEV